MIVLRNKNFSDTTDNKKSVRVGEVLGIGSLGTLASIEGSKLVKRIAKTPIELYESKLAKKNFKKGLKDLMNERSSKDLLAKEYRIKGQGDISKSVIDMIFHKKRVKKLDDDYSKALKDSKEVFKKKSSILKDKIISDKASRVNKKLSRVGKGTLAAGLITTGALAASKLMKDNKK